jgi:hypothetical protein
MPELLPVGILALDGRRGPRVENLQEPIVEIDLREEFS